MVYHALIRRYSKSSTIPVVLNMAFSVREERIICAAVESIKTLCETSVDALAFGPFCVESSRLVSR